MINMLIFLSISIFLYVYHPLSSVVFISFIYLTKSFKYKSLMILIFLLFSLRNSINGCQSIESGNVVEINAKSIIVNRNFTNVLVMVRDVSQYSLHDKVILYNYQNLEYRPHNFGFNLKNWAKSRNICYQAKEQDSFKINGKGFLRWLSNGGLNKNTTFIAQLRILLFQSNPSADIDLFISMGIIYVLIVKMMKLLFLKQSHVLYEQILISLIFLYLAINLAWPLSLIRVWIFYLSTSYFKDRLVRFSFNLIVCAFIQPYGLTQLAYLLPLSLQFVGIFLPIKSQYIQRNLVFISVLILFNHSVSIINILLFPLLSIVYRYLIISSLLLVFMPFLNPVYSFMFDFTNVLFKWSMGLGILKGNLNLIFIICFIIFHHYVLRYQRLQSILLILLIMVGIPVFSLPFFYTVTMINIGQGDAFLIQAPFNQNVILIDTGPENQYRALKTYLDAQAIDRIDYLVITHDDSDHSGNMDKLSDDYNIEDIVYKGKDIINQWLYLEYLEFNQTNMDDNDSSLVYYMKLQGFRFLFLGDLSTTGEYKLIAHYPNLPIDILKVGHHGSNTSTSDGLLKHIKPRIALISVGKNNYGHPHYDVIKRLNDFYITYFDSLNHGDVRIIMTPLINIIVNSMNDVLVIE